MTPRSIASDRATPAASPAVAALLQVHGLPCEGAQGHLPSHVLAIVGGVLSAELQRAGPDPAVFVACAVHCVR